jgi:dynein assembly factor 5
LELAPTVVPAAARGATDAAEKVRELSVALLARYVERCAGSLERILPSLVPTLVSAMGRGSADEPSEEIRLARATLVGDVCANTKNPNVLASFADELCDVMRETSRDAFHDVKKATHRAVQAFVEGLALDPEKRKSADAAVAEETSVALLKNAAALCASVLPDARHRHSQVRLSCLRAVSSLVPFLTVTEMEELVTPGLWFMCADRTPGVRFELHRSLTKWIVESNANARFPNDGGDSTRVEEANAEAAATSDDAGCALPLAPCLLPMLLTGVADETDANALAAATSVEEAGAANEAALARRTRRTKTEKVTRSGEDLHTETVVDDDEETRETVDGVSLFPHPFDGDKRPSHSARTLVASVLNSLFPLAIKETREWTASKRNAGARLLGTTLLYAREKAHFSPFLPSIVHALIDAVTDDDKDTAARVLVAARALGHYARDPERSWIPLLVDAVAGDVAGTPTDVKRAASLVIAAAAIRATPPARLTASACRLLADALASPNVLNRFDEGKENTNSAVRTQCLSAAANLVAVAGRSGALFVRDGDESAEKEEHSKAASASLFRVLLQTRAAESTLGESHVSNDTGDVVGATSGATSGAMSGSQNPFPPSEQSASAAAMANLAAARGFTRVDDLYLAHANDALFTARVEADSVWDTPNPSQRAFCAFFLDAPISVFKEGTVADECLAVFRSAGTQNRDPRLRAAMLQTMDAAFEEPPPGNDGVFLNQNRGGALIGGVDTRAVTVLESVVLESLVWRAGATAAAARYAAVVCLGTMLRRSLFFSAQTSGDESAKELLVSRRALLSVLFKPHSSLLPGVFSAMEEDYYADTRKAACYALDGVLATAGLDLGDEKRRSIYPEILKRMDDSRDDVRVLAARCARRFFLNACPLDWDETNCLYFLKPLAVHMDDPNELVRNAVLDAFLAAAEKKPAVVIEALTPAKETHRFREHVERAVEAANATLSGER